eukprot:468279_1
MSLVQLFFLCLLYVANDSVWIDQYNTYWDLPGIGQWESMPIGNGNLAANIWLMPSNNSTHNQYDLWTALAITSSYDLTSEWLKTIQLKLTFNPPITNNTKIFQQNLYVSNATLQIITSTYNISINIDANNDTLYVYSLSNNANINYTLTASIISWRKTLNYNPQAATDDKFCHTPNVVPIMNDIIDSKGCSTGNNVLFYHRNYVNNASSNYSSQFMYHLEQQLLSQYFNEKDDPYYNLTFGGVLSMYSDSHNIITLNNTLTVKNVTSSLVTFSFLTLQTPTLEEYIEQLCNSVETESIKLYSDTIKLHDTWWKAFWNRSWISISTPYANETNDTYLISLLYNHQRYLDALDGRSKMGLPIKFNGQAFWIDDHNGKPDYKDWGAAFWWQNTRQPYYNTLHSGDLDLNENFYNMYYNQLNLIQKRNNVYFNISGGFLAETAQFNGLYSEAEYGWHCGKTFEAVNTYIKYHWVGGLELVNMLLDDYIFYQNGTIINHYTIPI